MKGGRVLFVGCEGSELAAGERRLLARLRPFGIVLFRRNMASASSLRALITDLRRIAPEALLGVDAEGGRVDRLRELVGPAPAAADLARCPPGLSRRSGRWIGAALAAFGFDLDFAPVVDLDHCWTGNALDRRCFGDRPGEVVRRAGAFLEGLAARGIGGCVKHFPGLGGARADTHVEGTRIDLSREDLERELEPFVRLGSRADALMACHAVFPAWGDDTRPATLSPAIAGQLLRERVGYRGPLLSDDLEMGALTAFGELPELGVAALAAGCDGLLFCRRLEDAPAIAAKMTARSALRDRLDEAAGRLERLRRKLLRRRRQAPPAETLATIRRRLAALVAAVAERVEATR